MTDRINLLYVIPIFGAGGTERLVADLATRLDPRRFHVSVCVQYQGSIGEQLSRSGYSVYLLSNGHEAGSTIAGKLRRLSRRVADLRALLSGGDFHVVHTHHIGPLVQAFLARIGLRRWRWIHTEHIRPDVDTAYPRPLVGLASWMFASADVVTGVSDAVGAYFLERGRVAPERVRVIYNGVDVELFAGPHDGPSKRRSLGIPLDAWVIGLVATLRPQKNHELLIRALARIHPRVPEARLVLAGDGELGGALADLAHRLGVGDRVHFLGSRSDIPELLAAFDVYCLPSHFEGMPLTLFEAMAAERPIVATRVVGIREVIRDGDTGLLIPPDDPDALAEALLRIRHHPEIARHLVETGRRYVRQNAQVEDMVARYEALYEEVLVR